MNIRSTLSTISSRVYKEPQKTQRDPSWFEQTSPDEIQRALENIEIVGFEGSTNKPVECEERCPVVKIKTNDTYFKLKPSFNPSAPCSHHTKAEVSKFESKGSIALIHSPIQAFPKARVVVVKKSFLDTIDVYPGELSDLEGVQAVEFFYHPRNSSWAIFLDYNEADIVINRWAEACIEKVTRCLVQGFSNEMDFDDEEISHLIDIAPCDMGSNLSLQMQLLLGVLVKSSVLLEEGMSLYSELAIPEEFPELEEEAFHGAVDEIEAELRRVAHHSS